MQNHTHEPHKHWLHYLGLGSSGLCLIHCLAMPFLIPFLPVLSAFGGDSVWVEVAIIALIGLSTITIFSGYRSHKSRRTLVFAAIGFVLLVASLFVKNYAVQLSLSCTGSVCMILAQYRNYRLCRADTCAHHHAH